jgi:hypothetical protein
MNRLIEQQKGLLEETTNLRTEVLEAMTDKDLGFSVGGKSLTLQDLLLEQASTQLMYVHAFKTFKHDWSVKATPPKTLTVVAFKDWFMDLDKHLVGTLEQLSDEDLTKPIDRGGWNLPVETNFHVYREAVLIFAAKASIYLRAMGKELPTQLGAWIG